MILHHRTVTGLVALAALCSTHAFIPRSPLVFVRKAKTTTQEQESKCFAENSVSGNICEGNVVISYDKKPPTPSDVPNEVFLGVALPPGKIPKNLPNKFVSTMVNENFAPKMLFNVNGLVNTPKSPLTVAQGIMAQANFYGKGLTAAGYTDVADYNFFGGGDHITSLITLLKTNPFWASALTKSKDGSGYELISFDPNTACPQEEKSLYLRITETLNGVGHRVNFFFDSEMNFKDFKVYDAITGERDLVNDGENEWATAAMYNLFFYASCQHATIHTLHYLTTSGFQWVAHDNDFEAMDEWADVYASNIQDKYEQVGTLLVTDPAPIPALAATNPAVLPAVAGATYALLTGPMGFGSSQDVRPIMKDMLDKWGQSPTAEGWIKGMFNIDIEEMKKAGILTEFWKHYDLIPGFATAAASALRKIDSSKAAAAEKDLEAYLKSCGSFQSKFSSFENWIEVMAITGIIHGCTLSYTRAIADNEVLKWRDRSSNLWDTGDMNLLFGGLGTIVGMQNGRHVMGTKFGDYAPELLAVLDKYNDKAEELKVDYAKDLMEKPEFNDYGWILTDFCPDGFDGKQLTMATYI